MRLVFLNPAALWLLFLGAAPLLVHLLVKRPARRVPFPTLRFVPRWASRAARVHRLADWPLLIVRTLIILAAAAAVARPLLVTPWRANAWEQGVSRLIIIDTSTSARGGLQAARAHAASEAERAVSNAVIETADVPGALNSAAAALSAFPPSRREAIVISDFQEGTVDAATVASLPAGAGLRFVETGEGERSAAPAAAPGVPDVIVSPRDAGAARRAVRAVASRNRVPWTSHDSRVVVAVRGAPRLDVLLPRAKPISARWMADVVQNVTSAMSGEVAGDAGSKARLDAAAVDGRLVLVTGLSPDSFAFVILLDAAYRGLVSEHAAREALLPRDEDVRRNSLQRAATGVPPDAIRRAGTDDARWWWVVAALLLGIEGWLRSRRARRVLAEKARAA